MTKYIVIARSNFRKAKGQMAAIFALILIASLMLNLWLMLSMDYKQNFDRYHKQLNAEHVMLTLDSDDQEIRNFIAKTLENDKRTVEYRIDDAYTAVGSFQFHDGEVNNEFVILDQENAIDRAIGKIEIVEKGNNDSGVYLPMLYKTKEHSIDKTIDITLGNQEMHYTISGFLNSVMAGSHNCSITTLLLTHDQYKKLENSGAAYRGTIVSVRIDNKSESQAFEADLKDAVSSKYPQIRSNSNSYTIVSSSRYISQMICSGMVSAMAFFVTLITIVVIASNVINYIQTNMRELGVQKAIGYKSSQIISALLLQFLSIAIISSSLGIACSYCLFPPINNMMISQTGIPYAIKFLALPCVITMLLMGITIALSVWLSARRIKKIEPIAALRFGIQTHNFKNNYLPLEKNRLPLQLALALKTTLSNLKQNITVCITMFSLSLVIVFTGLMTENVIVNMDPFINLICGETADSCININTKIENEFIELMKKDARVKKFYLYHTVEVRHVDGLALSAMLSDDFELVNNKNVCIKGRFPKHDNELAIAVKYAKDNNIEIGDEITLTADGHQASYIICGFSQISNYLGKDCLMTRKGYKRMGMLGNASYYIDVKNQVDIDDFNEEISKQLGQNINESINVFSIIQGTGMVYVTLMTMIVIAILFLSVLIIAFVFYLLVRTMLNNKKQEYGIMKAIGFTTKQLIIQTAISFMPAVVISTIIGITVNAIMINPLTALFLNSIGIMKCNFTVPLTYNFTAGFGLIIIAFLIACLLSIKIKKISPIALLADE